MKQFPPNPRVFHYQIFSKIHGDICSSRFATGVNDTGGKWKKCSIRKILIILFGHLWVVEKTYIYKFLPSSSLSGVCNLILFQSFATGVNNTRGTGGKICHRSVVYTGGKFCRQCHWYPRQFATGGKFATGVVDTSGAPWLAIFSTNCQKIWNDPNVIIRGLGEGDSW